MDVARGSRSTRKRMQLRNIAQRYEPELRQLRTSVAHQVRDNGDTIGPRLVHVLLSYRADHGCWPTWREAYEHAGFLADIIGQPPTDAPRPAHRLWHYTAMVTLLRELRAAGWVSYSRQPRSLRPARRGHARSAA